MTAVISLILLALFRCCRTANILRSGYPGEVYYKALDPQPQNQAPVALPYIYSKDADVIGFEFGLFEKVYAFNFTILECVTARIDHLKSDTVCLIGPNTTTPDAQGMLTYQLRKYSVRYPQDKTIPVSSFSDVVLNISLRQPASDQQYRIFAGDNNKEVFIFGSTVEAAASITKIRMARIFLNELTIELKDSTDPKEVVVSGIFQVNKMTKLSSACEKLVIMMNWIDTSKSLQSPTDQPPNNIGLFIDITNSNPKALIQEIVKSFVGTPPDYVFEIFPPMWGERNCTESSSSSSS